MSDFLERISKLSPRRLALLALELHEQVEAARAAREPIAIVGMACRYPGGASDPARFWDLLRHGRDAIRDVPRDRWDIDAFFDADPDAPGRMSARGGGFLDEIDGFDPAFFGIAPREAQTMDPQQRLLLEVAWEALEHAGASPEGLAGAAAGVFVGICNSDHLQRVLGRGAEAIDAYLASGNAHSVAAGRIAYFLGLHGPALAIDTACSSSLVALHLACRSLRGGETRLALAGGVNVMCSPETTIALSKAHMLAPDSRCKTFDAAADGFARGEGCGVLVLKRLSDATADGDRVLALIRGTAANQDGRSGGLTVPSGPAQEAVIRAALADAGVTGAEVDYVEAHGTGTSLGDPIEVRALGAALGAGRADPLVIGSVKTNLGHLESAAGVAGVMKVVLALQHEQLPPHLHFRAPSPHIAWAELPVVVAAEGRAWPRGSRRRLAGVSSFGFSGTNAHVILEEAPLPAPVAAVVDRPLHCLPLSARTDEALAEVAARFAGALATAPLGDAAHTAGVGRSHFTQRLAVVAGDGAEAIAALAAAGAGRPHQGLRRGTAAPGTSPEVVFLYSGQGAQVPGMGRALLETSPVYRQVIERCDALLGPDAAGRTLRAVLLADAAEDAPLHQTAWTQPALFAVELALTELWRSWGVTPAAVLGHSVGEYAAACAAGVFTLEEGLRLVAERGRLMQALPAGGTMAAVFAPVDEVAAEVARASDRLAIAAINAADSVVVSGDTDAVEALLARFAARDVRGHRLRVSFAAHSPRVAPALDALEAAARATPMRPPRVPIAWNLGPGGPAPGAAPDASYWRRHLREPVRFADGVAALHRDGYRVFLEVGPHPTLVALAQRTLPAEGSVLLASLRRGKDDWRELQTSLAELYVRGVAIDWAGVDRPYPRRRVPLPTYPFQRRRFWIDRAAPQARRVEAARGLLGARLATAVPIFEATLTPASAPYLADHRVRGVVLLAGPVFLEMAQAAARAAWGAAARAVEGFVIHEPLVLPDEGRTVQVHLGDGPPGTATFAIHSRALDGGGAWRLHAAGRLVAPGVAPPEAVADAPGTATSCDAFYERLVEHGITLGPAFRTLVEASRRDGEVVATVALPPARAGDAVTWAHPALLDGALQAVGMAVPVSAEPADVYFLAEIGRVELAGPLPARLTCHARLRDVDVARPAEWRGDVTLRDDRGAWLGTAQGVCLRRATRTISDGLFYEVAWEPAPAAGAAAASLEDPARFVPRVRERFAALAREHGLAIYQELLPELDRLSAAYLGDALRQLGFDAAPGRVFRVDAEAGHLGVAPRHRRLFARLLAILAEDGALRPRGEGVFEVAAALPPGVAPARVDALLARFSATDGELGMLRRCGPSLARVLRGEQDPLPLLFPGGSFAEARKLYVESPYARTYSGALAAAVAEAVATVPAGARLRILEIGAGTGGTTGFVLPRLPGDGDRVEYTFTDVSPLFLERAAPLVDAHPFVRRALLDIERDPVAQGFAAGGYDVIIAANVLHATADLGAALAHARALLAPGGLLLLLEGMAPERWVDLTFGLTEGWWRFDDHARRAAYPLIDRRAWLELLGDLGFSAAAAVPDDTWTTRDGAQQALLVARAPRRRRRWTLVGGGVAAAVAALLDLRGDEVTVVPAVATDVAIAPADEIVYLGALDEPTRAAGCELPLLWLARAARGEVAGRVWLVTAGAQPPVAVPAVWQASMWGAGRVFALEHPARWGGLVDLPAGASAAAIVAALDADDGEDQTAWRDGRRLAARLAPAAPPAAAPVTFRPDATYLVTGGFGGLGLVVARWLAERGARHVALLGRRPDPTSAAVRAIEALGARVIPLAGDVADEAALAARLRELAAQAPPLRGVVHAAADLGEVTLAAMTPAQAAAVLRPKIDGALALDRLTRGSALDFLVLFSSSTALLGAAGLAHYAAANAFFDAFADAARRGGRRVLSVGWGTWEVMRGASAERQRGFREAGLVPMSTAEALDALGRLLAGTEAHRAVARIDWQVLRPLHEARRRRPFLARLGTTARPRGDDAVAAPAGLAAQLRRVPASLRPDLLVDFVSREVAAVLGVDEGTSLPLDAGLFELGMDSLMSVELKRRLERGAGRALPATLTFNHPSVGALAAFLERELEVVATPVEAAAPAAAAEPARDDLDELSDDELEARLLARLEKIR